MLRLIRDFVSVRDLCFLYGSALVWVWISCCAGLSGYYMGALRWDSKARSFEAGEWGDLRELLQIADLTSRNMAATRIDRRRAVEPVRRINPAALRR